jgi:pimeloyl-ACP methyl ester carboxylesterase
MEVTFKAPGLRYLALEQRVVAESMLLRATSHLLAGKAADPHPVLVLPGLGATDRSTSQLRNAIARQGHDAYGWGLGRHGIWTRDSVAAVQRRLAEVSDQHGAPVSLVGISAGGILARELAREHPDAVRQVITIVSPFRHRAGDDNRIARVLSRVRPQEAKDHFQGLPREDDRPPLNMPTASIYSKSDGVIDWRSCLVAEGYGRDNIEVWSSHLGAGTNLSVAIAALDRLALRPGEWTPFRPPLAARALFPQHLWGRAEKQVSGADEHAEAA